MNWAIKILIVILFLTWNVPQVQSAEYEDKALITYKGKQGYFFIEETGDKILGDLVEYHALKTKMIPSLELKIEFMQYSLEMYEEALAISEKATEKAKEAFKGSEELRITETKHLREQLNRERSWYKSPTAVFIVGIIVGGVLAVGLTFGLREANER